jgi:hypothetical protein
VSDVFANFVANLSAFLALTDLESGDDATKSGVVKDRKLPEVIAMLSAALFDQFFQQRSLCIIHRRQTKERSESFQPFCKAPKVPKVECSL